MTPAVVVPVHADPEGLRTTLSGLAGHRVVVVVDGPHAATEQVAHDAGARFVVLPQRRGSYAARNAGLDALDPEVDVVLLTDAGCVVAPGWAAAHLRALSSADLTGGAVEVTLRSRPSPAEWVDRCRNLRQQAYVEQGGFAATCNLGVRRALLDELRFDANLLSGGDRELCHRATARGARLVYVPDAVVHHPARTTSREVLAKARRVGAGLAALPAPVPLPVKPARVNAGLARRARAEGLAVGTAWAWRAGWLDHRRARVLRAAALEPAAVAGLHVVVLLGSRWSSLRDMNTRWRQVTCAWASHPDVARVTLVDYPRFRPGARRLVTAGTSWHPGVQVLDLTVPTTQRPAVWDRLAWWRAARAVRAALPPASQRLVVCASPVVGPLLPRLRRCGDGTPTTTAFDAVDVWRSLTVAGDHGARIAAGFHDACTADRLTAVSSAVAHGLRQWTPRAVTAVPNGVDLRAYTTPQRAPEGLPDRPFAVYVGSLSSRLDLTALLPTARLLCGTVPVVLAGPATPETAAQLTGAEGISWLGPIPTELVPGLLQRAAVGLFLHRPTDHTEASDSMKLLEYAAAGLPVVANDLPGLPPDTVVARGCDDTARQVRRLASAPRGRRPADWVLPLDWAAVSDRLLAELVDRHASPAPQAVLR